jgi:(2R)-3-sulfolactate dehydrogenase (NADP+)
VLDQSGTRLPGERRLRLRAQAENEGVNIPAELLAELRRRAGGA